MWVDAPTRDEKREVQLLNPPQNSGPAHFVNFLADSQQSHMGGATRFAIPEKYI